MAVKNIQKVEVKNRHLIYGVPKGGMVLLNLVNMPSESKKEYGLYTENIIENGETVLKAQEYFTRAKKARKYNGVILKDEDNKPIYDEMDYDVLTIELYAKFKNLALESLPSSIINDLKDAIYTLRFKIEFTPFISGEGKTQYIDENGNTTWVKEGEKPVDNPRGFRAATARPAFIGEDRFLTALKEIYGISSGVVFEEDDLKMLLKGNVKPIVQMVKSLNSEKDLQHEIGFKPLFAVNIGDSSTTQLIYLNKIASPGSSSGAAVHQKILYDRLPIHPRGEKAGKPKKAYDYTGYYADVINGLKVFEGDSADNAKKALDAAKAQRSKTAPKAYNPSASTDAEEGDDDMPF